MLACGYSKCDKPTHEDRPSSTAARCEKAEARAYRFITRDTVRTEDNGPSQRAVYANSLPFSARAATTAAPLGLQSPSIGCDRQSESQNGNPDGRQKNCQQLILPRLPLLGPVSCHARVPDHDHRHCLWRRGVMRCAVLCCAREHPLILCPSRQWPSQPTGSIHSWKWAKVYAGLS